MSRALLSCFRVTEWVRGVSGILPSASRSNAIASSIPANMRGPTDDVWINSRQPLASVNKCPAMFPLSTLEMYFGSSGRRSRVSYQLYK